MSLLTVYNNKNADQVIFSTQNDALITEYLMPINVKFERWVLDKSLPDHASHESILAAYQTEINKLVTERGYQSYDVVSMTPEHPQKVELRQKFLAEHIHKEDEIRFFTRGCGLFVIHTQGKIYSLRCEKNDLISVPANTKHWFDMGENPNFSAIRIFDNPAGWVAHYTGSDIAKRYPELTQK